MLPGAESRHSPKATRYPHEGRITCAGAEKIKKKTNEKEAEKSEANFATLQLCNHRQIIQLLLSLFPLIIK